MKKVQKKQLTFLICLAAFMVACVIRFFDKMIIVHENILPALNTYGAGEIMTMLYLGLWLFFFFWIVTTVKEEQKSVMYYLIIFLVILVIPLYLCQNYLGCIDIYVWMLTICGSLCLAQERLTFLVLPGMLVIGWICPMAVFGQLLLILGLCLLKYGETKEKKYIIYGVLGYGFSVLLFLGRCLMGQVITDAQEALSMKKYLGVLVLLCPYFIAAICWLWKALKNGEKEKRSGYVVFLTGVAATFISWSFLRDFNRAILLTLANALFGVIYLLAVGDVCTADYVTEMKTFVKEHIPIPMVILLYAFAVITFWMLANDYIDVEVILTLQ
jgi:hypothetical protein